MKTKKLTLLALLTAAALVISLLEASLPPLVPVPGIKLGLANVITLWIFLKYDWKDALLVLVMRIILASIFGGQMLTFFYSLSGGLLCFLVTWLSIGILGKSFVVFYAIIGAIFHNIGQILAAMIILQSLSVLSYLPVLLISGILCGLFTGLVTLYLRRRL